MRRETTELTVLCLIRREGEYLLQDRRARDWQGYTLPGGHIEPGESIVDAVIREMKEETGLTVLAPRLCGVKQFPIDGGRYLVFLFETDRFEGEIKSSDEGNMYWVPVSSLASFPLVPDFRELLQVMLDDTLTEFQYVIEDGKWMPILK